MAEDDIYGNKRHYEVFLRKIDRLAAPVDDPKGHIGRHKYWVKNPTNLPHFHRLVRTLEAQDLSYPRRLRLMRTLQVICYATQKELSTCTRTDIESIVAFSHSVNISPKSKSDFVKDEIGRAHV